MGFMRMIGAGRWGTYGYDYMYVHKLYFEELVCMEATPDTTRRFCGALNRPPLERFYLCPRRIQEELDLFLDAIDLESVEGNDLVPVIDCSEHGHMGM